MFGHTFRTNVRGNDKMVKQSIFVLNYNPDSHLCDNFRKETDGTYGSQKGHCLSHTKDIYPSLFSGRTRQR
jgi:hypothetical protein